MSAPGEVPPTSVPAPPRPGVPPPSGPGYAGSPYGAGGSPYEPEPRRTVAGVAIPGASTSYGLLGVLMLAAAILSLVVPYRLADWFFRGHHHTDVQYEELWRLLASCFLAGAVTCYALKVGSDRRILNDWAVQRLQMGLVWWAVLAIVLHVVHAVFVKSLTLWGLLLGAVVMAPTLLLPSVHLGLSGGYSIAAMSEGVSQCFSNLFAPRRISFASFLYSLLTVLFTLAGLVYLILPRASLQWVFGYHAEGNKGQMAAFLWQWIGAAMLCLFPTITYSLTERSILGRLHQTVPRTLNVALLLAALFHILELGSLLADGGVDGRWLLPVLVAHWALALLAAVVGLTASDHAAVAYEYEPLLGEPGPAV